MTDKPHAHGSSGCREPALPGHGDTGFGLEAGRKRALVSGPVQLNRFIKKRGQGIPRILVCAIIGHAEIATPFILEGISAGLPVTIGGMDCDNAGWCGRLRVSEVGIQMPPAAFHPTGTARLR